MYHIMKSIICVGEKEDGGRFKEQYPCPKQKAQPRRAAVCTSAFEKAIKTKTIQFIVSFK